MNMDVTLLTITLLMIGNEVATQDVTVTFDANPAGNIREGLQVLLSCHVSGSFNEETDALLILKTSGVPTKLASKDGLHSSAPESIMFVGWYVNPGSGYILRVSIFNISRADRGNYACKALRPQGSNTYEILAQATLTVDVLYPPSGQPICEASPSNPDLTYYDGDKVTFRCTSDDGNPAVPIEWFSTVNVTSIPEAQIQTVNDSIVATLLLTLDADFDGITFSCIRKTDSNTLKPHSCSLGPLTVLKSTGKQMNGVIVAIVVGVMITAILMFAICCILIKSEKCKILFKIDGRLSHEDGISPNGTHGNGTVVAEANNDDNHVYFKYVPPPKEEGAYAVLQKDKLQSKPPSPALNSNKAHPNPQSYQREMKNFENTESEQYANIGMKLNNPNSKSEAIVYANI